MNIQQRKRVIDVKGGLATANDFSGISAGVIAYSQNEHGDYLCSMLLRFPRFILAELNTHRAFSRNSASSRAIPFKKLVDRAMDDPFVPIAFQKDHKGMQGTKYLEGKEHDEAIHYWLEGRWDACKNASHLQQIGVTKQICNRMIEPYLWHDVIITSANWQNFFALRCHPDAEIHMQTLAYCMLDALKNSKADNLYGVSMNTMHIPFGNNIDTTREDFKTLMAKHEIGEQELKACIAIARCARVSYLNFEGKDDYYADITLFDRLRKSGHMSPFEHVAKPSYLDGRGGNFGNGWEQYRKTIKGECRTFTEINHA